MNYSSCRRSVKDREKAAKIRDRILLYARGLDIDPVLALDLALQSMRESIHEQSMGPEKDSLRLAEAMAEFRRLLLAREQNSQVTNAAGLPLTSMPPINRCHMLPEDMNCFSVKRVFKKFGALFDSTPAKRS